MELFKPMNLQSDPKPAGSEHVEKVRCLIIGSGPAGYTAAIYASRANLKPVLYTGMEMGGQLTTTTEVENFPGYPEGISGPQMMEDFKKQAGKFGAEIRFGIATDVDFSGKKLKVFIDENKVIEADAVIIATGATARYLGIEAEKNMPAWVYQPAPPVTDSFTGRRL
jgi:thioredoxin reductase (NADPH)